MSAKYRVYLNKELALVVEADDTEHAIDQAKDGLGPMLKEHGRPGAYQAFLTGRWRAEVETGEPFYRDPSED